MTDPIRIPLVSGISTRLPNEDKDALASNIFYDKDKAGNTYATKRPGLISNASGFGLAQGIYGGFSWAFLPIIWSDIKWNGTTFCAVSRFVTTAPNNLLPISATSTDGIDWDQGLLPEDTNWSKVDWDGTVFCTVGFSLTGTIGHAATSIDGKTWTSRAINSTKSWLGITSDGAGRFVATAYDISGSNLASFSIDNGVSWTLGDLGAGNWRDVAWNSSAAVYCAIDASDTTKVATSPTGATWTNRTIAAGDRFSITSNNTLFVTVSHASNKAHSSTDGITWTERTLPAVRNWIDVEWTGSHFVALANGSNGTGFVAYSTDGITWAETQLPTLQIDNTDLFTTSWQSVAGNTEIITALSEGSGANQYAYSQDDGLSYTADDLNRYFPYPAVEY